MRLTPFLPTWRSEGKSEPRIGRRPHGRRPRLTAQQEQPECRDHSVTGQTNPRSRLGEGQLRGTGRDLPEVALRICEEAAVPAPGGARRRLRDVPTSAFRFGKDLVDAISRADVVR